MKIRIAILVAASLSLGTAAYAQNQTGAAASGMTGAESTLRAKGDVKGAARINRAMCLSGLRNCTGKYAIKGTRAMAKARR
jgi:hypothetical protein